MTEKDKTKTPIADAYNNFFNGIATQSYEKLKEIELKLQNAREEAPSKAIEVLNSLEEIIRARVKTHEEAILANLKAKLESEFVQKKHIDDRAFELSIENLKKNQANELAVLKGTHKEEKDKLSKDYNGLLESRDAMRDALRKKDEASTKEDREVIISVINQIKATYEYRSKETYIFGKGMLTRKHRLNRHEILTAFQKMLKSIGMDLDA